MTDIHTHILPNVDDGARNTEESLALLNMLAAQGVTSLFATPHFYALSCGNFKEHIAKINETFNALKSHLQEGMPHIYPGHEVHYFRGISNLSDINLLTLNNSKYMLLELPYEDISSYVVDEIIDISLNCGITPILAHLERYVTRRGIIQVFDTVKDGYTLAHINSDSLLESKSRKLCLKLIKDGLISFMASDTHSVNFRPPTIGEATEILKKKIGSEFVQTMEENAARILTY